MRLVSGLARTARDPEWVQRPFFARFDAQATWMDQLRPAFGERKWFWQDGYGALCKARLPIEHGKRC